MRDGYNAKEIHNPFLALIAFIIILMVVFLLLYYVTASLNFSIQVLLVILTFAIALLTFLSLCRSMMVELYPEIGTRWIKVKDPSLVHQRLREHATIIRAALLPGTSEFAVDYLYVTICNTGPAPAKNIEWKILVGKSTSGAKKWSVVGNAKIDIIPPQGCREIIEYLDPRYNYLLYVTWASSLLQKEEEKEFHLPKNSDAPV